MDFSQPTTFIAAAAPTYLMVFALPLAIIDIRQRRLPNRITLPGLALALAGGLTASAISGHWFNFAVAIVEAVLAFVLFWGANTIGAIGMGDVKLITLITLSLGWFDWTYPLVAIGVGFAVAVLVVLPSFVLHKVNTNQTVPLGPYLLIGFMCGVTALVLS